MQNISSNLKRIKPGENLSFKYVKKWTFRDGYTYHSELYSPIFILYNKDTPIGIINYRNSPFEKEIIINFIQGIKQDSKLAISSLNKPFYEIILDSFLIAAKPLLEKGKKVIFLNGTKDFVLHSINIIKIKKNSIEKNNYLIEKNNQRIANNNFTPEQIKTLSSNILILKKENENYEKQIKVLESMVKTNCSIRDRYFDKDGNLNFNKERVKRIFLKNKIVNEKKIKLPFFKFKKRIK